MTRNKILPLAHPYFNPQPATKGKKKKMTDYVQTTLLPIPAPRRDPWMNLDEIVGEKAANEIRTEGQIIIHTLGDSGHENGANQELVAEAMTLDYDTRSTAKSPAFLLHLGDVIYFDNTDKGYQGQFYVPYKKYPGKIIAIPGNHDGELFKYDGTSSGQKKTLGAFQRNFCQPTAGIPPDAGTIYRQMVAQPGVYWWLDAPFIDIIGLYSNIGEGPGFISGGKAGQKQKAWLIKTLKTIGRSAKKNPKALVIAVHHPPISKGGHSSSTTMLADMDDACNKAGIHPDAVLAAHAHCYQRFTRSIQVNKEPREIPYYVVGTGGRGLTHVEEAKGQVLGDYVFESSLMGYGYLTMTASRSQLKFVFTQVENSGARKKFDKEVRVDLKRHKII